MSATAQKPNFREADRAQVSFLAPLEKKCLIWLAHHTPGWINSDHLTVLGLIALLGTGLSYWWSHWHQEGLLLAIGFLMLNWLGDSLDGTLARVRQRQRPRYGFYVDHVVDAFGTFLLLAGLGLSGYMSPPIAAGLLIAYFMLSIEVYLATYTIGTFHLSFWKFSPTELRILLMVGNIALLYRPVVRILGQHYRLFDVGGLIGMIGIFAMLILAVVRHTILLYNQERLPKE
ncbi:MAG TPA: CDP-alcohol phosphatidyltransferase family protein [Candidatus Sulfopaludibacter sp.]|jgi:phosphatidylglycerophosphate synthase|nr:CDP-alcohol phosphatidyltransferase family protein [Candidatus Sulfopaludibacter sp.]